jgi:hypothetical protein
MGLSCLVCAVSKLTLAIANVYICRYVSVTNMGWGLDSFGMGCGFRGFRWAFYWLDLAKWFCRGKRE